VLSAARRETGILVQVLFSLRNAGGRDAIVFVGVQCDSCYPKADRKDGMPAVLRRGLEHLRMWKIRKSLLSRIPQASSALAILFDSEWYLEQNPDVRTSGIDPLRHYLQSGGTEGRDPHPLFDSDWYLEQNPDVREAGVNPLVHYLERGWRESRDPSVLFSLKGFVRACPEAAAAGLDPLTYYLSRWRECGAKLPVPVFRRHWYIAQYLDAKNLKMDPLVHYLKVGAAEGKNPNPLFESEWYAHRNPDVAALKENPLVHYLRRGAAEGRPANTLIKGRWYIDDIDESGVPGGLKWALAGHDHVPKGPPGGVMNSIF
jgi:hypothetical protein